MKAWTVFAGMLVLLLTAFIIIPGMNDFSMWHDEVDAFEGANSLQSPADLYEIEGQAARIVHPPLFFVLLKGWIMFTGADDFALRTLTFLFTIIAVAFIFRLMLDMTGRVLGGAAAGAILGCMGYISYYTRTMHNHSLLVLTVVMLVFFYHRWWRVRSLDAPTASSFKIGTNINTAGLVFSTAAVMYTHYYGAFSILALNAYALYLVWGRLTVLWAWFKTQLMAFVLYIPWLPGLYMVLTGTFWESGESGGVESTYIANADLFKDIIRRQYYEGFEFYVLLFAIGLFGLLLKPRLKTLKQLAFPVILFALTIAFAALANTAIPTVTSRRLIALLIPVAMLLAYMIAYLPRSSGWGVLAVFLILTPNEPNPLTGNLFYRQTFEHVMAHGQKDDVVYVGFGDWLNVPPMIHYSKYLLPDDMPFLLRDEYFPDIVNTMWPRDRVWLIWVDGFPTTSWNDPLSQKTFTEMNHTDYGELNVTLYEMTFPEWELPQDAINLGMSQWFGGQFELINAFISSQTIKAGDTLDLWLDWRIDDPTEQQWAVFVHFVDANGVIHGQADSTPSHRGLMLEPMHWPIDTPIHDHYTLTIEPDVPAGEYEVRIGIYDRSTITRLLADDGDDGLVVARVVVE